MEWNQKQSGAAAGAALPPPPRNQPSPLTRKLRLHGGQRRLRLPQVLLQTSGLALHGAQGAARRLQRRLAGGKGLARRVELGGNARGVARGRAQRALPLEHLSMATVMRCVCGARGHGRGTSGRQAAHLYRRPRSAYGHALQPSSPCMPTSTRCLPLLELLQAWSSALSYLLPCFRPASAHLLAELMLLALQVLHLRHAGAQASNLSIARLDLPLQLLVALGGLQQGGAGIG